MLSLTANEKIANAVLLWQSLSPDLRPGAVWTTTLMSYIWVEIIAGWIRKDTIHPSIHFLPLNPSVGSGVGWSLSQQSSGESKDTNDSQNNYKKSDA